MYVPHNLCQMKFPLFKPLSLSLSLSSLNYNRPCKIKLSSSSSLSLSHSKFTISSTSPCSCVLCLSMSVHLPWKGGQRGAEQMASKLWHLHQHLPLRSRHSHHPGTMDDSNEQREFGSTLHPPSTNPFLLPFKFNGYFFPPHWDRSRQVTKSKARLGHSILTWGHSSWARSRQVTRAKARLDFLPLNNNNNNGNL